VSAAGASNSPLIVRVLLTVTTPAGPSVSSVVNSASLLPGAIAPGEIVTIFGSAMGPVTPVSAGVSPAGLVDTILAGTRVWFDEIAAPLLYASSTRLTAVVPYEITGKAGTRLQVEVQGTRSPGFDLRMADTAPGIYTIDHTGTGPGALLNQDSTLNSASNPASRGSIVLIYATGEGQTDPAGINGIITGDLRKPLQPVAVSIGGEPADLLYAGSAPGLVGVLQVNARVPESISGGSAVPVLLTIGQSTTQAGVVVSVQN
jgi:uncharacterized protein (TIGR03437 family)